MAQRRKFCLIQKNIDLLGCEEKKQREKEALGGNNAANLADEILK
jgi:hypothetical protein